MQKNLTTICLIAGIFLCSMSSVIAESGRTLPYFAGDSSAVDPTEGDLVIFNASRGFFPLPLSANGIPNGMVPVNNPTLALVDTLALSNGVEDVRGLVVYRVVDGMLFLNTFVGHGNESAHSASYFGEGDFAMVITERPDDCASLNLTACRAHTGFLEEKLFAISFDGSVAKPIIAEVDPVTNSITADLNSDETVTAHIDDVIVPAETVIDDITVDTIDIVPEILKDEVVTTDTFSETIPQAQDMLETVNDSTEIEIITTEF